MHFLDNMKISTRLILGFACITAMIALMGLLFNGKINQVQSEFQNVAESSYPKVMAIQQLKSLVQDNGTSMRNLFIMADPPEIRKQLDNMVEISKSISTLFDQLSKTATTSDGQLTLAKLRDARAAYTASRRAMVEQFNQGQLEAARATLQDDVLFKQQNYLKVLDDMIRLEDQEMAASSRQVDAAAQSAKVLTLLLLASAISMAVMLAFGIIRSITQPLQQAVAVTRAVAGGDLTHPIHASGRSETAELLLALRDMQHGLTRVVSRVRQGSESVASASAQISEGNSDLSGRTESQASSLEEIGRAHV